MHPFFFSSFSSAFYDIRTAYFFWKEAFFQHNLLENFLWKEAWHTEWKKKGKKSSTTKRIVGWSPTESEKIGRWILPIYVCTDVYTYTICILNFFIFYLCIYRRRDTFFVVVLFSIDILLMVSLAFYGSFSFSIHSFLASYIYTRGSSLHIQ